MTNESQTLNVKEFLGSLRRRQVPIPYEVGTYLALEACEQIQKRPSEIDLGDVWVDASGVVKVDVDPKSVTAASGATQAVLGMLSQLLLAAAPGVPEPLIALVEPEPGQAPGTLPELRDDLLSRLVPLNRQASRRVLGRLLRDAARDVAQQDASQHSSDQKEQLDTEVDSLLDSLPPEPSVKLPQGVTSTQARGEPETLSINAEAKRFEFSMADDDLMERSAPTRKRATGYKFWFWVLAAIGTVSVAFGTIILLR